MPVLAPIDLTQIPDTQFPIVPNGRYLAEVAPTPQVGTSKGPKTAGATTVNVRFVSADNEYTGGVFEKFILADSTFWKWKQFLAAVGMSDDVISGAEALDTDDLVGMQCYITVGTDPQRTDPETGRIYEERNKITKFEPADAGGWAGI